VPVVDFESAWFGLKAHIATKRSHGQSELMEIMAMLEVGNRLPEGQDGFDDRPLPHHDEVVTSEPAGDDHRTLHEPAAAVLG
jgi:hypothetical protein